MRVLHVVRPAMGGMRRHVAELCRGLRPFGVDCHVAAPPGMAEWFAEAGERVPLEIAAGLSPLRDLQTAFRLRAVSRGYPVVHCHGLRAAWIGWLAKLEPPVRRVVTLHNVPDTRPLLQRVAVRMSLADAAILITVSEAVAAAARPLLPDGSRVEVIRNGVHLPSTTDRALARARLGMNLTAPVLLAVGRLSPEKGFHVLIEALAGLGDQCPLTWIVGDGPERSMLEVQLRALGLESRVTLIGYRETLGPYYDAADLIVVPSLTEGQGLVALEAMAHGRAVLASRVGGLPEVVQDGVTGRLIPHGDAEVLRRTIVEMLRQPDRLEAMGREGRERVAREFSAEAMLRRHVEVYRSLVPADVSPSVTSTS